MLDGREKAAEKQRMAKKGGNPQNLKPWPKGVSGNPKGLTPQLPDLKKIMAETLGNPRPGKGGRTGAQVLVEKLYALADKGNLRAAEMLLERGYGRSTQGVELTGKDGGPLEIKYDTLPADFKE